MIDIPYSRYVELRDKGHSWDTIYLLDQLSINPDLKDNLGSPKVESTYQSLIRKNLITEEGKISLEGKALLSLISSPIEVKLVKKKPKEETFLSWWFTYPGTSTFEYKGKKFVGDRALRVKKADCEAKINKILNEGEYSIKDLIDALKLEIQQKMESSYKEGKNKMQYFQNSLTYLNQATYIPYIELMKSGYKIEEKSITTTSNETYI